MTKESDSTNVLDVFKKILWTLQLELQYHIDKWLEESKKKEDHLFNGDI